MSLANELLDDLNSDVESEDYDDKGSIPISTGNNDKNNMLMKYTDTAKSDANTTIKKISQCDIEELVNQISLSVADTSHFSESEQKLLIKASIYIHQIEDLITAAVIFVKQAYRPRFPELDSIITNSIYYIRVVKVIGNDLEIRNNAALNFVSPALIMIVSVTAATTQGQPLSNEQMDCINESCDKVITLDTYSSNIFEFIESRMILYLPNSTAVVGVKVMAEIISSAGGLFELKYMDKSKLLLLGLDSESSWGRTQGNEAYIYHSEMVQSTPLNQKPKIAELVAEKLQLAIRVDANHESIDGQIGKNFCQDIKQKVKKLKEISDETSTKESPTFVNMQLKRDNLKTKHELKKKINTIETKRRHQKRMSLNDIEDDGLFQARAAESAIIDEETKIRIKNVLMKNLGRKNDHRVSTTSIIKSMSEASGAGFTPLQGLQIKDPSAAEKLIVDANRRYFSDSSGFMK